MNKRAPAAAQPPVWNRRGTVVVACAAMCLVIFLGYAGGSWALALYPLLTDGPLALLWLVAAYGIGSLVPLPDAGAALRAVTRVATGLGAMSLLTLGLGLAGGMNRVAALSLLGLGIITAVVRLAGARKTLSPRIRAWWDARAATGWLWALAMPMLAIALLAAFVPPGVLWGDEPNGYDVVEYHLQVPREWYEAGRISGLQHNVFSYFPFNVEMQFLLAMHVRGGPWAGMYLAQLMHVGYVALSVAAVYAVARSIGGSGTIAGACAAATPWLALLGPVAYNEGGLLLYGTLAVGWTLHALRDPERRVRVMAVAGAMAGFACGVKLTALPMLLLPLPVLLIAVAAVRREAVGRAAIAAVMFGVVGLVLFSPWLARNVAWTGNPVFPEAQNVFGRGHFTEAQSQRWTAAHAPRPDQQGVGARLAAAWDQIAKDVRFGFVLFPLAFACAAASLRRPETWLLAGMLVVLLVIWLGFTHLQSRFFVLAIPVAALLVGQARAGPAWMAAGAGCVVLAVIGFGAMDRRINLWLHEKQLGIVLGLDAVSEVMTPEAARDLPADATLALVGDAKAFLYQRPMARLRYRTVFDVPAGDDWLAAWQGGERPPASGRTIVLVDPGELARFGRTYRGLPPVPPQVLERGQPFVIESVVP